MLSTGRQDFGLLRSTLLLLRDSNTIEPRLWAGGMHLDPRFGRTVDLIAAQGIPVDRELPFLNDAGGQYGETAEAVRMVGAALADEQPFALLLAGDRTETLAAGISATLARVPIAHLHGGEESEGAIDNACRHALTKLSHLHLVSHQAHAERVLQMGEDPESVIVVGAPGLDNRYRRDLPTLEAASAHLHAALVPPIVLVTMHPTTLADDAGEVEAVAAAMERVAATYVITQPNADAGGERIREFWRQWGANRPRVVLADALGDTLYWALLGHAAAVLGNSSSGIVEAAPTGVPAVNVGDRQKGRLRIGRVWDVVAESGRIEQALGSAIAAKRGAPAADGYPSGPAAPRIVAALELWAPPVPPRKRFRRIASA